MQARYVGSIRFHLIGFTSSLTLSSKCFATFPHGTCSLSVSWSYLALDGVYHPLWAAFPNNPTPRAHPAAAANPARTGLAPSRGPQSRETWSGVDDGDERLYTLQFRTPAAEGLDSALDCSPFSRPYYGNPCWFLFLRLLICLSSAGDLT